MTRCTARRGRCLPLPRPRPAPRRPPSRIRPGTPLLLAALLLLPATAGASGLESGGIGTRSRSLGGAFVAVADDWTALYYNPAGVGSSPGRRAGAVYELFTGGQESSASLRNLPPGQGDPARGDFTDPVGDEPRSFRKKSIDAVIHSGELGYVRSAGRWGCGLGLFASGAGSEFDDSVSFGPGGTERIEGEISFTNGAANVPLALSAEVAPGLRLGAALTLRYGLLDVEYRKERSGALPYTSRSTQDTDGFGAGVDLGLLWKPSEGLSLGAVARLPYAMRKEGDTTVRDTLAGLDVKSDVLVTERIPFRGTVGAAAKVRTGGTLAASATWLDWSRYERVTGYESPVPSVLEDSRGNPARWHDAWVLGLGYEQELDRLWTVRGGVAWDEAPEPPSRRTLAGGQVVSAWKLSLGAGYRMDGKVVSGGYTFTRGGPVSGYIPGATYEVTLHELYVGIEWL